MGPKLLNNFWIFKIPNAIFFPFTIGLTPNLKTILEYKLKNLLSKFQWNQSIALGVIVQGVSPRQDDYNPIMFCQFREIIFTIIYVVLNSYLV